MRSHTLGDVRKLTWAIAVAEGEAEREREVFFSWQRDSGAFAGTTGWVGLTAMQRELAG